MRARTADVSRAFAKDGDALAVLRTSVGDLEGITVFHNYILVATYIEPEKTSGGIFLPEKRLDESRYQGKVGLVLKTGPISFKSDAINDFGGLSVRPGDWVLYRPADGQEIFVRGVSCRLIEDKLIKMRVASPEDVY